VDVDAGAIEQDLQFMKHWSLVRPDSLSIIGTFSYTISTGVNMLTDARSIFTVLHLKMLLLTILKFER